MPNSINLPACTNLWTEQQIDLYNKLDFYLAKVAVDFLPKWEVYESLCEKQKWMPNMGPIMRAVHIEPTPVLRSTFFPQLVETLSYKDVIEVREATAQSRLRKHRFESNVFNFVPSFQDFIADHINPTMEQITRMIQSGKDIFTRTYIWECSPNVWVGGELVAAPHIPNDATMQANKTTAWIQAMIADAQPLDLRTINLLGTVMESDLGATPYEGSNKMEVNEGLKGKFCLVIGSEVWNNFTFDQFLLDNRQIDLNIVTERFKGSLWGKWTTKLERFEMRIAADGTIPVPETIEEDPASVEYGETKMNPAYVNAPYAVAFAFGGAGYRTLSVGPPPAPFSAGSGMSYEDFQKMDWNGKVELTRNILVPCLDGDGNVVNDTNKYGEGIQAISQVLLGSLAVRRRNVVPIIYQRQRVGANIS